MLPKDTLTCGLVPNAIKNDELSCSVPPLEYLQLWSTIGDVTTALLTFILVGLAAWAGWTAVQTLKTTRQNSIEQTRPYVFAQVVPSIAGTSVYDLVVRNTGQSTAQNLRISCPQFPTNPDRIAAPIGKLFDINHTLPPGTSLRTFWHFDDLGRNWSDGEGALGMPRQADVVVSYEGPDGRYTDTFPVNIDVYAMAPAARSGHDVPTGLSKGEQDLHKMLAVIAESIGELKR